ncbi:Undecaprenyl-phosphate galactosephosphotransferase [Dehalobacter sp. DCA]|jgi:Sugar transferases involved in lipopolysaccharide synthesis|uniref:sugar transferase n=1 Tax=Dehalobacter sp. DCA TaxID=1147129 RepID=UPI00028ACC21|nr:sugar transferase [Dehalobacter sp. DCA]AFV02107.1 Undecaprenyl-phosphate galactosephosphotransferase [Dehalobacter sp. DCA]
MESKAAAVITTLNDSIILEKSYPFWKRTFDVLFSIFALLITSPFTIIISLQILLIYGRPVTFKQQRIGYNGKPFKIIKFRSMCKNAEDVLRRNPEIYQYYLENDYKLPDGEDPRVTKFGRFLRKTSLDELLQFWNVLKGDMSVVGPRPIVLAELEEYGDKKSLFLSMKPGVTGVWQVSGRSNIGYPERVDVELSYLNKQSLTFDILVIFKTIFKVIKRSGAY